MKVIEVGKILAAFSESSDGDLGFYNMTDDKADATWNELSVVKQFALSQPTYAKQVHQDGIIQIYADSQAFLAGEADGLITDCTDRPLGVFSADCLPLLIFNNSAISAVHAGWRSTCLNIAQRAIEGISTKYGIEPRSLKAYIGPCINQCCLEMGEEVYQQFIAADAAYARFFVKKEKWHLDLRGLNRFQLTKAGLDDRNIVDVDVCTYCNHDDFFSFRRQRKRNGSMFSFVVRRK